MARRYDAVLFDAGETLVHPDPSFPGLVARLLSSRGITVSEPTVEAALDHAFREAIDRGEPFSISPEVSKRFWTRLYVSVLGRLGIREEPDALAVYLYDAFTRPENYALFPDSVPALVGLREAGYRLGIVSNWEAWLPSLLDRLGLTALVEVAAVSGIEGIEKPDPRIFEVALRHMDVAPDRAVYVGDNPVVDVEAARALGMHAVLIDRRGRHGGDHAVSTLTELPGAIE